MPGANPVMPVISAVFFLAGRCQGWRERPGGRGGGGSRTPTVQAGGHSWVLRAPRGALSVGLCRGGAAPCPRWGGVGDTVPSPEHRGWPSSPELFAALSAHVPPPTAPVPALGLSQPPELPRKGLEVPPPPAPAAVTPLPGHSSQPVPEPAWRLGLSLPGSSVAVASSCPGSDFVGEVC